MNLENQVCSLELAKKLKELGSNQHSIFYWKKYPAFFEGNEIEPTWKIIDADSVWNSGHEYISAFTVAELGEILPIDYCSFNHAGRYFTTPHYNPFVGQIGQAGDSMKNEADSRAKMLIYLLENKLL